MPHSAHTSIHMLAKALGYSLQSGKLLEDGLCKGISVSWLKACLIGEESQFNHRVEQIISENETLAEQIDLVRKKVREKNRLTRHDHAVLEIHALFDSIMIHQAPDNYSDTTHREWSQKNIVPITAYSQSLKLEEAGGVKEIYSQSNLYSHEEMVSFFSELTEAIAQVTPPITASLGFILDSHNHSISLCYDAVSRKWTFMDINQWPPKSTDDLTELAHLIRQSVGFPFEKDPAFSCFNTTIFSTASAGTESLIQKLIPFKQKHRIQQNLAKTLDPTSMLLIMNYDREATELLATHPEASSLFHQTYHRKETAYPLPFFAAKWGYASIVAALITPPQNAEQLTTIATHGLKMAYHAAEKGHALVIREIATLSQAFELLNEPSENGFSPTYIAALNGHSLVIAEIAKLSRHFELLNTPNQNDCTPVYAAAYSGHASVISEIVKLDRGIELLSTSNKLGLTPIIAAIDQGQIQVLREIAKHPRGIEALKAIPSEVFRPIPVLHIKKFQALMLLEEINRTTNAYLDHDKANFLASHYAQIENETALSKLETLIHRYELHLVGVKELNRCIQHFYSKATFFQQLKHDKANKIEMALQKIPMEQRDGILNQDTDQKRTLCRILASPLHTWHWRKKRKVYSADAPIDEKHASGSFQKFSKAIQRLSSPIEGSTIALK